MSVGPRPSWMTGMPARVEFRQEVKFVGRVSRLDRGKFQVFVEGVKAMFGRMEEEIKMETKKGGVSLVIRLDDIQEMATRLNKFGNKVLQGTLDEVGGWLHDIVHTASEGAHREIFDLIGRSAKDHMRDSAYRMPKQRRGGPKFRNPFTIQRKETAGGGVVDVTDLTSRVVSRWEGKHAVWRTGWLHDSIQFKVILDPSNPKPLNRLQRLRRTASQLQEHKEATQFAIELLVGPGAGEKPAPPYAKAQNDGDGPIYGRHYVPNPHKYGKSGFWGTRLGYLARGGVWQGYEGKHYLEETAQWLVRDTPRMQMRAHKFARIYVDKAVREYRKMLEGGIIDISDKNFNDLVSVATVWVEESTRVSTDKIIQQLHEIMAGDVPI